MKYLALAASAVLMLAACKSPEIAIDPFVPDQIEEPVGVVTDDDTRAMLVKRCLEDRTQTEESCKCDVAAMEANFSQDEWWQYITGEEPEYIVELTPEEQEAQETRMFGYLMASGACYGGSHGAEVQASCKAAGDSEQVCACLDTALAAVAPDDDYAALLAAIKAGQPMAGVGEHDAIMLTCRSFGGWPGEEWLGQEAPQ